MTDISQYPTLIFIRRPEVLRRCGISNTTLHRLMNAGDFPRPIQLGPRAVAWVEEEVFIWIEQRIEASRLTTRFSEQEVVL